MNFATIQYFAFFAVVFAVYWHLPRKRQNILVCLASYLFYASWDWRFLSLIVISTGVDFVTGARIHASTTPPARRAWLVVSLAVNLGILGYFKYFNFFADSFADLLQTAGFTASRTTLDIILPVGISFYTFQTLSYSLDIYRGRLQPTDQLIDFAAFVAFFPQLVAGPIVRAREFLYQLESKRHFTGTDFQEGSLRFLTGLFKKAFVADTIGAYLVDPVFDDPARFQPGTLWLALFGYGAQIYADFSGYSDMAIGSARMLGFHIPENFATPYISRNISEFWRRWHMTMSRFFRDYVYIALGGNRRGRVRTLAHLAATTLVSGLWHGAGWTFVLWGGLHGVFLALNQTWREWITAWRPRRLWVSALLGFLAWAATYLAVHIAWVLFRASNLATAREYVTGMVRQQGADTLMVPTLVWVALGAFAIEHVIGFFREAGHCVLPQMAVPVRAAFYAGMVIFLHHGRPTDVTAFIYFQF